MESQKHAPCALCAAERPLRLSHVIPKFVFAWMKSRGEFIRGFGRPNLPLQDGPKVRMLCGPCESRLSVWERAAATSLFRPANSASNAHFDYGSWLLPFAVSLSFRVMRYFQQLVRSEPHHASVIATECESAAAQWAAFLLGAQPLLGPHEHHCVVLPSLDPTSADEYVLQHFIDGVVDFQPPVVAPDGSVVVVTKMCRICIIGTVKRGVDRHWTNTRIAAKGGVIEPTFAVPSWFVDYLRGRFMEARLGARQISEGQRARLWDQARRHGWDAGITLHPK